MITGYGILAFRDPFGIRPLVYGKRETAQGPEYMAASESVALDAVGFELIRDIQPGEAVFFTLDGQVHTRQCAVRVVHSPCIFEFVYFARPDSDLEGQVVHRVRQTMGQQLAEEAPAEADGDAAETLASRLKRRIRD